MARPKTRTKPSARTNQATTTVASPGGGPSQVRADLRPDVLTLAEVAAFLRVPEADVVRMVGPRGLPGRLIGSEWRFSRTAVEGWLRTPPEPSSRESLLALAGAWRDDPHVDDMVKEIYRQRGRPMTEDDS
jgi:excisionase family DNA binding protein